MVASIQSLTPANSLEPEMIRQHQEADADLRIIRRWVRRREKPRRGRSLELRQYISIFELLYLNQEDVLYRRKEEGEFFEMDRMCLPSSLQTLAIQSCHEMAGGHMGMNVTTERILRRFYFPGAYKEIENFVASCAACQQKIKKLPDQRHTLISTQEGFPFQKISIDFLNFRYCLLIL